MIKLKNEKIFAEGSVRKCYIHPDDSHKLLKVMKLSLAEKRRQSKQWYKKIRPLVFFDSNLKERKSYDYLERKNARMTSSIWSHFPKCYGIVETDLGDALCVELMRNDDGTAALGLREYITTNGFTTEIENEIHGFCDFLLRDTILISDMHIDNLVVCQRADGCLKLYLIDGLGNTDFLPIANMIRRVGQAKIQRKIGRLHQNLNRLRNPKTNNT